MKLIFLAQLVTSHIIHILASQLKLQVGSRFPQAGNDNNTKYVMYHQ